MLVIFGETMSVKYGCSQMIVKYSKIRDSIDIDEVTDGLKRITGMGGRK
jgi:hypothetical protein